MYSVNLCSPSAVIVTTTPANEIRYKFRFPITLIITTQVHVENTATTPMITCKIAKKVSFLSLNGQKLEKFLLLPNLRQSASDRYSWFGQHMSSNDASYRCRRKIHKSKISKTVSPFSVGLIRGNFEIVAVSVSISHSLYDTWSKHLRILCSVVNLRIQL